MDGSVPPGLSGGPAPGLIDQAIDARNVPANDAEGYTAGPPRKRRRIEQQSLYHIIPEVRCEFLHLLISKGWLIMCSCHSLPNSKHSHRLSKSGRLFDFHFVLHLLTHILQQDLYASVRHRSRTRTGRFDIPVIPALYVNDISPHTTGLLQKAMLVVRSSISNEISTNGMRGSLHKDKEGPLLILNPQRQTCHVVASTCLFPYRRAQENPEGPLYKYLWVPTVTLGFP